MRSRNPLRSLLCLTLVVGLLAAALPVLAEDSTASTVSITSPAAGSTISGKVDISGTAYSADPAKFSWYKVEYSVDGKAWVSVDVSYQHKTPASSDAVLATWDTSTMPNAGFWLMATVVDKTGNYVSSAPVAVTVANEAAVSTPAAAETATAAATPAAAAVPPAAAVADLGAMDLAGLLAYVNATYPGLVPVDLAQMDEAALTTYVTAVAASYSLSDRGTAGIYSPVSGASLSGTVTIMGSASTMDPAKFGWYKVEYSLDAKTWMSVDADYQHKAAVSVGQLATWDTTKVPDTAYWLMVTVVDNTGNYFSSNPVGVAVANTGAGAATATAGATSAAVSTPAAAASGLAVTGLVTSPVTLDAAALAKMTQVTVSATPPKASEAQNYTGVRLNDILAAAGLGSGAATLVFTASDGFTSEVALSDVTQDCLIVTEDGKVNAVMPGLGNKAWAKDLIQIEVK